jgi:MSHA biogenesis protein MshJ
MINTSLKHWMPILQTRWQRGRRAFDARLLTERRLIVVAVVCVVWLIMDNLLVTPSYGQLSEAFKAKRATEATYTTLKGLADQHEADILAKQKEASQELEHTRQRVMQGEKELQQVQSMLAPAREMRHLLEGLLAQHGQLKVKSMTTVAPREVNLGVGSGPDEKVQLYRHGMDLTVEGSFHEMLDWLVTLENLPQRLLWDGIQLSADEQSQLTMSVSVHTFSPDRDTLEIAP